MKFTKQILTTVLVTGLAAGILNARDDDQKAKPYRSRPAWFPTRKSAKTPA